MTILITGGAGYVGFSLLKSLNKKHGKSISKVIILDILSKNTNLFFTRLNLDFEVTFAKANILDNYNLDLFLDGVDIVYHLAARVNNSSELIEVNSFENTNNWGTSTLVNSIEKTSTVIKVIYLSTISVYGNSEELLDETSPTIPNSAYAISKLKGESQIRRIKKSSFSIIRSGNIYGHNPCLRINSVVNKFMFEAQYYNRINIEGSGNQYRGFININTIGDVLVNHLLNLEENKIENAVTDNYSLNNIAEIVKEIYPSLETYHINNHLPRRSLKVNPISGYSDNLKLELENFKKQFTF